MARNFGTSNGEPIPLAQGPSMTVEIVQQAETLPRPKPNPIRQRQLSATNPKRRSRGWLFTDHNYEEKTADTYKNIRDCIYGVIGNEKAPETGSPHLQGYVYLKFNITFSAMKKRILTATGREPNFRAANGTADSNFVYCSKDGDWIEWGKRPQQGKRIDLLRLKIAAETNMPLIEVWRENFEGMLKYHKGFAKFKQLIQQKKGRAWRTIKVTLIMGPTGIGKTKKALYNQDLSFINDTYLIHGGDIAWWDGYEGEKRLVIDEYANQIKITDLLSLLDGNMKRLNVKHAFSYALWTDVVITTNLEELHEKANPKHKAALARRITTVINLYMNPHLLQNGNSNAMNVDPNQNHPLMGAFSF